MRTRRTTSTKRASIDSDADYRWLGALRCTSRCRFCSGARARFDYAGAGGLRAEIGWLTCVGERSRGCDRSVSPRLIRSIAPRGFVVTVACHDAEAVFRAADEGADYAVLAPVFAPLSKPAGMPPLGLDALRAITARARIPVIALGGVTEANAPLCVEAGAAGVAGITLFQR